MDVSIVDKVYELYVRSLSPSLRLQLVERIEHAMTQETASDIVIVRICAYVKGILSESMTGQDAQEWVTQSRKESDRFTENSL